MAQRPTERDEDYRQAGFGEELGFGRRPALLLVDAVLAYLDPASPLYAGAESALAAMERLYVAAKAAAAPVIFTNVVYTPGGVDGGHFYRKIKSLRVFDRGGPWAEFPASLRPTSDDLVVTKQYASAFFGTSLAATLTAMGRDSVLVGGYSTSGCVRASALDALQHGFIPIVVREACGDRNGAAHEANLFDLAAKYADVVSEAAALTYLRTLKG